jgi:6-phosphogluconate dehydrogenase
VIASIDEGVPAPVITASLIERFESRGLGEFGDKVLSALRSEFGGHAEKPAGNSGRSLAADPTGT